MNFIKSLIVIVSFFAALFLTTFLLDLQFVKSELSRQLLVYMLMAVELYIGIKFYIAINKA